MFISHGNISIILEVEQHSDAEEVDENLKQVGLIVENSSAIEDQQEVDHPYDPEDENENAEPFVVHHVVFVSLRLPDDGHQDKFEY